MVIDIKERQPIGMMPGGVQFTYTWDMIIAELRSTGMINPDETVTHVGTDLTGCTFRVERGPNT